MLSNYLSQTVVVDTDSTYTYIGILSETTDHHLKLTDVVLYDSRDARVPLEKYLIECADYGTKPARTELIVWQRRVVAVTPLASIVIP